MKAYATAILRALSWLTASSGFAITAYTQPVQGQPLQQEEPIPLEQRAQISYDAYTVGPGDGLQIELVDLPELSGIFAIGPDGTLYLPRLRALYVEGLTVQEVRNLLTIKFASYVQNPEIYVRPVIYRPIRVYVGGEVRRPGFYTLSGVEYTNDTNTIKYSSPVAQGSAALGQGVTSSRSSLADGSNSTTLFPTVFDAIRSAQGITPYTDLSNVQVIRKRAQGLGGGKISTNLNFLSLITKGNTSQNIRLQDGDVLKVASSPVVLREQLLNAGQSNLNPQFMEVYVTGRVKLPGSVIIPQGSTINQAISLAGGAKLLRGRIEFVRFTSEGTIDRRIFAYRPSAAADTPNNPILAAGDLIRIQDSIVSGTVSVLDEITSPIIKVYSSYSLLDRLLP